MTPFTNIRQVRPGDVIATTDAVFLVESIDAEEVKEMGFRYENRVRKECVDWQVSRRFRGALLRSQWDFKADPRIPQGVALTTVVVSDVSTTISPNVALLLIARDQTRESVQELREE
jgi:hypothetical protein